MNVNKININQSEQTYDITSDAYDITYEDSNVGEKLSELTTKIGSSPLPKNVEVLDFGSVFIKNTLFSESGNVLSTQDSSAFSSGVFDVLTGEHFLVKTRMQKRTAYSGFYIYATDADNNILGRWLNRKPDETGIIWSDYISIEIPTDATKLWVLKYGLNAENVEVIKITESFQNVDIAILNIADVSTKNKIAIEKYDANVGNRKVAKELIKNVDAPSVGGFTITDGYLSISQSTAWRNYIIDVNVGDTYKISTYQTRRAVYNNFYIYGVDSTNKIISGWCQSFLTDNNNAYSDFVIVDIPEQVSKLYILQYGSVNPSVIYKIQSTFENYADAIEDLSVNKVEKEKDKQLSTNDYSNDDKNKVANIPNDISGVLNNKIDKDGKKVLSTYDFNDYWINEIRNANVDEETIIRTVNAWLDAHPSSAQNVPSLRTENIIATVGVNGDFLTINAAIDSLSRLHRIINVKAEIKLLSGFIMREQVTIESNDLSWIDITSEDDVVIVDGSVITTGNVTRPEIGGYPPLFIRCVFAGINATLPNIKCLFKMINPATNKTGICVVRNSKVFVDGNCGFNGAWCNIYATHESQIDAFGANFSFATGKGVCVFRSSSIAFGGGKAVGCAKGGIYVDSNSDAELSNADFSFASVNYLKDGNGNPILDSDGNLQYDENAGIINPTTEERSSGAVVGCGIEVGPGCSVQIAGAKANHCLIGIQIYNGGSSFGRGVVATNNHKVTDIRISGIGLYVRHGSRSFHYNSNFSNNQGISNVYIWSSNDVDITDSNCSYVSESGTDVTHCNIYLEGGNKLNMTKVNAQSEGQENNNNIIVSGGSIVQATGSTGGCRMTPNTITSSGLFIK